MQNNVFIITALRKAHRITGLVAQFSQWRLSMVISTLRLFPSQEQRRHVLTALRSVQGPTRSLSHCLCCQLLEEDGQQEAILYMQQWDSEEELHRHIQSDMYGRILGIAELSRIPPEFDFHYVEKSRHLDLIEALRCQASRKDNKP